MLITRRDDRLVLIEQNEHGRLAGQLVDHWGNERFAAPTPLEHVRTATATHDEGWREPDAEPLFNAAEGRPLHFLEIEPADHMVLYRRGIETVVRADPYAGLLVSMHWTGLYRTRWGMQTGTIAFGSGASETERLQDEAVAAEERRWIDVKRGLIGSTTRSEFEAHLWHNYELLQVYDLLSLHACLSDLTPADDAPSRTVAETLKSLDPEPGPRTIESVPTGPLGERTELTLRAVDPSVVAIDPYPFASDAIEVSATGVAIPDRRYADADDARAAVAAGDAVTVSVRFVRR